jgi:photosystem II PsbM protein
MPHADATFPSQCPMPNAQCPTLLDSLALPSAFEWYSSCVFCYFQIEAGVIMAVNDLGFVATILFVLVPSVFLIILYIQTASREGKKD